MQSHLARVCGVDHILPRGGATAHQKLVFQDKYCYGRYCCAILENNIPVLRTHHAEKDHNAFNLAEEENLGQRLGKSTQTNHDFETQPQYEIRVRSEQN